MRFQWVDLRDSGGNSLSALPSGLTAKGDARARGDARGGSASANYWKNGVLSNDVSVYEPFNLGDLYVSELSTAGELPYGPGILNADCFTWSTFYFHNHTTESYVAEFSVDYTATFGAADPQKFTDFNTVYSTLRIFDYNGLILEYWDGLSADDGGSFNRSVNVYLPVEPGWNTLNVLRSSGIYVESTIPEPSTYALSAVGLGLLALSSGRRRGKRV